MIRLFINIKLLLFFALITTLNTVSALNLKTEPADSPILIPDKFPKNLNIKPQTHHQEIDTLKKPPFLKKRFEFPEDMKTGNLGVIMTFFTIIYLLLIIAGFTSIVLLFTQNSYASYIIFGLVTGLLIFLFTILIFPLVLYFVAKKAYRLELEAIRRKKAQEQK